MRGRGSLSVLAWVLRVNDKRVGDEALRTLACIADYVNDNYECWPSISRLCNDRELSRATIYRHLEKLESAGYLLRGDQRCVEHLPANHRPTVWKINAFMQWDVNTEPALDLGVSVVRPQRGLGVSPGETAGVSPDATTEHGRKTQKNKRTQVVTKPRAGARGTARITDVIEHPGKDCVHQHEAVTYFDKKLQRTVPRCPFCRRSGRIVMPKPEEAAS